MVQLNSAIATKLDSLASGVLSGHYIFDKESPDSYLKKRFEKPAYLPHNITYKFTNNPADLQRYFEIREAAYREFPGHDGFNGGHEIYDDVSDIMVVKAGENCIGGIRLTVSTPQNPHRLPLEADVDLNEIFPSIDFSNITFGEPSRLALLPEFRTGAVMDEILKLIFEYGLKHNVDVVLGRSAMPQTRRFRQISQQLGVDVISRKDISMKCRELFVNLWAADFSNDKRYTAALQGDKNNTVIAPINPEYVFA